MIFYVLVCRECEGDNPPEKWLPIPFDSAENRGRWAAIHRQATGHDKWWVHDQPESDTLRDERSFLLFLSRQP